MLNFFRAKFPPSKGPVCPTWFRLTKWSNVIFSPQPCPELSHVCGGFALGKPHRLVYIGPITSTAFYSLVPSDASPCPGSHYAFCAKSGVHISRQWGYSPHSLDSQREHGNIDPGRLIYWLGQQFDAWTRSLHVAYDGRILRDRPQSEEDAGFARKAQYGINRPVAPGVSLGL